MGFRVSLLFVAACGGGGGFPDAREIDAPPPGGTFTLDWALVDTNSQNLACDKVGGQSVTVLAHNRAFDGGVTEPFTCSTGMGQSQALMPGIYDFSFELDTTPSAQLPDGVLATAPAQHTITISSGDNVRLAPLTFTVNATGNLALTMSTGVSGGNCAGGAGITSNTITLTHNSDGSCEPITVGVTASAITGQGAYNYTINCAAPTDTPSCIATDQTVNATAPSDAYTIHVRGKKGATQCWTNNDSMQVPPLGQTLMRQLNLGSTGAGGC